MPSLKLIGIDGRAAPAAYAEAEGPAGRTIAAAGGVPGRTRLVVLRPDLPSGDADGQWHEGDDADGQWPMRRRHVRNYRLAVRVETLLVPSSRSSGGGSRIATSDESRGRMLLRNEDGTETSLVESGERLTVVRPGRTSADDGAGLHPSLREGDVITTIDGVASPTYGEMYRMMCRGEKLVLEVTSSAGGDGAGGDAEEAEVGARRQVPQALDGDRARDRCTPLVRPDERDDFRTTDYLFHVASHFRVCHFEEKDRGRGGGNRSGIEPGFPGLCCSFCGGKKTRRGGPVGRYFIRNQKTFADRSKSVDAFYSHLVGCEHVPRAVKEDVRRYRENHARDTEALQAMGLRKSAKFFFTALWERLQAVPCEPNSNQEGVTRKPAARETLSRKSAQGRLREASRPDEVPSATGRDGPPAKRHRSSSASGATAGRSERKRRRPDVPPEAGLRSSSRARRRPDLGPVVVSEPCAWGGLSDALRISAEEERRRTAAAEIKVEGAKRGAGSASCPAGEGSRSAVSSGRTAADAATEPRRSSGRVRRAPDRGPVISSDGMPTRRGKGAVVADAVPSWPTR